MKPNEIDSTFLQLVTSHSPEVMTRYRAESAERFRNKGVPTTKNELYLYTDLSSYFEREYHSHFIPTSDDFREAEKFRCDVSDLDTHSIILVNGFYPSKDKLIELPDGIIVGSLNEAANVYPQIVEKHYSKYAKNDKDGLIDLNTALAIDGIFIYVPDGVSAERAIQIVNIEQSEVDIFNQFRNLIIVGRNASVNMIICDHTLSPQRFFTNAVTEVTVGENSRYGLVRVQNEHNYSAKITHTFVNQEKDSFASVNNFTLHGGLVRNNTYHLLNGSGAEVQSNGLFFSDKFQHIDNYVSVDHFVPNCTSNQLYKGVLDDISTGVFNGRIYVHPDAQKTNAFQRNNNLLLSGDASMRTKPHLEIYADDVKCSHGATVGQLDSEALFYLQTRGINYREAQMLLMGAFANEVINMIEIEALRVRLQELIMQRLRGELLQCANCLINCRGNIDDNLKMLKK